MLYLLFKITYPRAVMIKSVNAIVANGTVGRSWRSEDFTSKAVFLFHCHAVYFDFLDTWLKLVMT